MYNPRQILSATKYESPKKPDLSRYDPRYGPLFALDGTRISPADIDEYPGAYQPLRYRKQPPQYDCYYQELPHWTPDYYLYYKMDDETKNMGKKPAGGRKDFKSAASSSSLPAEQEDFSIMDQYINYPSDNEDKLPQHQPEYRPSTPVSVPGPSSFAHPVTHSGQLPHSFPDPPSTPKRKRRSSNGQPNSPVSPLRRSTRLRKPAKYTETNSVNRV